MRTTRRRWLWVVTVLMGTLTALCVRLWPHDRLLLQRAQRIASVKDIDFDTDGRGDDHVWVSDHTTVAVAWKDGLVFHDLSTNRSHHVPVKYWPKGTHTNLQWSPDGKWLLSWDRGGADPTVVGTNLQTEKTLAWPNQGDVYHLDYYWLSDSRRWLQYTTLDDGYFTVYSVDNPHMAIKLPFPEYKQVKWWYMSPWLTSKDHLLIFDEPDTDYEDIRLPGDPFDGTNLSVREYRLLPSVALLNTYHILSPNGKKLTSVRISPDGNRVAFLCNDSYVSPILAWLHHWLPRVPAEPQQRWSLWVTRLNGRDPHEIGHIPNGRFEANGHSSISGLQWLPSGTRLGFVYRGSLYSIPAE